MLLVKRAGLRLGVADELNGIFFFSLSFSTTVSRSVLIYFIFGDKDNKST